MLCVHVQVEAAKQLAPDVLLSLPDTELKVNIDVLVEAQLEFPPVTKCMLVAVRAARLQASLGFKGDNLQPLIHALKPWSVPSQTRP